MQVLNKTSGPLQNLGPLTLFGVSHCRFRGRTVHKGCLAECVTIAKDGKSWCELVSVVLSSPTFSNEEVRATTMMHKVVGSVHPQKQTREVRATTMMHKVVGSVHPQKQTREGGFSVCNCSVITRLYKKLIRR